MLEVKDIKKTAITVREKIAYGLGDVGNNFLFDLGQIYLLKFFTDSLGLPPAVAGYVFLFTKILDAITDVMVGTWIDRRQRYGRFGKFRTVMIYAVVPLAVCTAVSFYRPDFALTGKIIWAYFSYALFGTVYTFFNIPYGSMIPAMTKDPVERATMASFREAGAKIGLLVTLIAFLPLVGLSAKWFGEKYSFFAAAGVFALAGCFMQLTCALNIRERYVEPSKPKEVKPKEKLTIIEKSKEEGLFSAIIKSYRAVFKNNPLLILSLVNLFTFSAFNVKLAILAYYCQYVLNDISLVPYAGLFQGTCLLLGVFLVRPLVRRYGKKSTYITGAAIWAIADFTALFVVHDIISFGIFAGIAFFGSAFTNTLNWALIADAVEYGEWKTGTRSEGVVYSFFTFFRKLSQAVAGFVPGIVLAWVGYQANAVQTQTAIDGIKGLVFVYPGTMAVLTFLIMTFCYKLTDKRYREIVAELKERKKINH